MNFPRLGLAVLAVFGAVACSSPSSDATSSSDMSSGVPVEGEAALFPGFTYDTGLLPKVSPAQVSFKASAGGALKVSARGHAASGKLEGNPGSGKLAIDLHAKLEGHLKVTSALKNYDGDIPGLSNLDIAAQGEAAFDPFLLGDGEEVEAVANVPETKLPDVPLSGVPGHLELTVKEGTTVHAKLHGTCLRGADAKAAFTGATTMSGTLVLKATLVLDLPAPLNKAVDLPDISIDLPSMSGTIDASSPEAGISEFTAGSCAPAADAPAADAPAASTPPASGDGAQCTDLANSAASIDIETISGPAPTGKGGTVVDGTYALTSLRAYDGAPFYLASTIKRTMRIANGRFETISDYDGQTLRSAGTFTARNGSMLRTQSCPEAKELDSASYTATPTSLTIIFSDHTVYTFGKL